MQIAMLLWLGLLQVSGFSANFPSVKDFGASGDGVTNDLPAFNAAITSSIQSGTSVYPVQGIVIVPPGTYFLNGTLVLNNSVRLIGNGSGQNGGNWATTLKFPANTTGILVKKGKTSPLQNGADGSIIEGLLLSGGGGTNASAHGIDTQARIKLRDCSIGGFKGNGVNIVANTSTATDATAWSIDTATLTGNGGHGLYMAGTTAHSGVATAVEASNNQGWGIYDSSSKGNTYVGCRAVENVLGAYKANTSSTAHNMFLGCHSDEGQPGAEIGFPSLVLGGSYHAIAGSGYFLIDGEVPSVQAKDSAGNGLVIKENDSTGSLLTLTDINAPSWPWRMKYATGRWYFQWANLGVGTHIQFFNRAATPANGYARDMSGSDGGFGLPQGFYGGGMKGRFEGSGPPTSGAWLRGDIIYNLSPAAGAFAGWTCVLGGSPGTWKGFGALAP